MNILSTLKCIYSFLVLFNECIYLNLIIIIYDDHDLFIILQLKKI
jgi:hypothetical protein